MASVKRGAESEQRDRNKCGELGFSCAVAWKLKAYELGAAKSASLLKGSWVFVVPVFLEKVNGAATGEGGTMSI
jgi:hypothetical protein